eukprot:CAMPEP_0174866476 /NCGR_PEP_ID=MMETSP1114-20130205/62172_1 /TAXON_ID=312471 /ORGANISM="Neobodo designis, Strain CCAP 1951/1" /LENGTH=176 /DNA_ID=CAMNT_0016101639 /DNA_START=52 /DNA_END=578 /DNA_ORIENTATION=-
MPVSPQTRYRVVRLMKLYRREMLPRIDLVLTNFEADPDAVVAVVVERYGPEPTHEPLRIRVRRFLAEHDPSSVEDADQVCEAYAGRDAECIAFLCSKYSVGYEPDPPTPRGSVGQQAAPARAEAAPDPVPSDADGVPMDMTISRPSHRAALVAFYQRHGVAKTDAEVDHALGRFSG